MLKMASIYLAICIYEHSAVFCFSNRADILDNDQSSIISKEKKKAVQVLRLSYFCSYRV